MAAVDLATVVFAIARGVVLATDHLIVKAILGRRIDWGRHSPVD
jgi:hypothetical protein